jgi:uncharacterized SAM-binding protein YcdF (DUF218 family)
MQHAEAALRATVVTAPLRLLRARGAAAAALLAALLAPLAVALGAAWLHIPDDPLPARADAIVVLAGDHQARMLEGARLYRAGLAPALWITGDVPPLGQNVSLAEAWRLVGSRNGVPEEAVTLLPSRTTWEDGAQVAALAAQRGARSLVVVSSWYHLRRVRCVLARQLGPAGPQVAVIAAPGLPHAAERWWREPAGWRSVARELAAVAAYWPGYGLAPWPCTR